MSEIAWTPLGSVSLPELWDVRGEMHWAAQAVEGVGRSLAVPEPNSEHIALRWRSEPGLLASAAAGDGRRAALSIATGDLVILDASGGIEDRFALSGGTPDDGVRWVRAHFEPDGRPAPDWTPIRDDLVSAPVRRFGAAGGAHAELESWYRNAASLIGSTATEEPGAERVLCWPHHFDIARFVNLDPDKAQYEGRSVNIGMSPGDETFAEPYYYVVPYPTLDPRDLPVLSAGVWHTDGWVGAVLTATQVIAASHSQAALVGSFVRSAFAESKQLLGA